MDPQSSPPPTPIINTQPALTPVPPLTSPINPHSRRKLIIYGFVAILGIIGIAAGAYILGVQKTPKNVTPATPTPVEVSEIDPTADWKTYSDPEGRFTLRYPSDWFTGKSGDGTVLLNDEEIIETVVEPDQVAVTLGAINDKELIALYPKNPPENSERKVINGITFDYLTILNTGGQPPKQPIIAQSVINDTLYTLSLSDLSQKTTFDQILSTFKLTDSESSEKTSDLTYTDDTYDFSFEYPKEYYTEVKDFPENDERIVYIKKTSAPVFGYSFTVKPDWNGTGNAQSQPKNFTLGGAPALRVDPPAKTDTPLERYQTNVYVEKSGEVIFFACPHNWVPEYTTACDSILSSFKFL